VCGSYHPSANFPSFLLMLASRSRIISFRVVARWYSERAAYSGPQHGKWRIALPLPYEALPPAFHLLLGQVLDEDVLLNVEVEREHGSESCEVAPGKAQSVVW
jgi:hypothetical protein